MGPHEEGQCSSSWRWQSPKTYIQSDEEHHVSSSFPFLGKRKIQTGAPPDARFPHTRPLGPDGCFATAACARQPGRLRLLSQKAPALIPAATGSLVAVAFAQNPAASTARATPLVYREPSSHNLTGQAAESDYGEVLSSERLMGSRGELG
jgi:hypothetical protein